MTAEQLSVGYAAALAVLPGVLTIVAYALAWALLAGTGSGLPGVVASAVAGTAGGLAMLAYLLYRAWLGGGLIGGIVAYTDDVGIGRGAVLAVGLAVWAIAVLVAGEATLDAWLADAGFGWVPADVRRPFSSTAPLSGPSLAIVVAAAVSGLLLPIVEELYFRGYLLPRLDRLGAGAPVLDAALFAAYHLWVPWSIPTRFLAYLPLAYAAWRTRNVVVAVAARVLVGLLTTGAGIAALSGAV